MRRLGMVGLAAILSFTLAANTACQRMVEVQSGTRVVCTQGEVISEDIKTVRVPASKAGSYRVQTVTTTCEKHTELATTYAAAQAALAAGDIKLAALKLDQVILVDRGYRKAQEQRDAIAKGGKPKPDTPAGTGSTTTSPTVPPTPDGTVDTAGALKKWIPDTLTGYTAGTPAVDPLSVSREYFTAGGAPVASLVIVAEQFRTPDDAKRALDSQVKRFYSKDDASVKVKSHSAYFGTDGSRFATLGFTDGAVMVAVEASPKSGAPRALQSVLEQIAGQLP